MGPFDLGPVALLIGAITGGISFLLARRLSRGWRARRREREVAAARARETRQQRRARERRGAPR